MKEQLSAVYEEIMWLASRPNVTPSVARSWYTHATSERLKKYVRRFSGYVSSEAVASKAELRLEHFLRIQTTLTKLVKKHAGENIRNPEEFVKTIIECEQVHIVTVGENYAAMKAKGDYSKAGIELVAWKEIELSHREYLWKKMLRGKVSNYKDFRDSESA